ncbi:MAG: hypothetical protein A2622_07745 [Bdellovibrionales bacterium RIFCSPHIGHO2_01_FULL_40_29]|nr:MAG: hypothetical protein A2622_07745 [Bdellovibrionales bacterium RIFCSPHIGHO2_01_FULL_40_29]OFZ34188.1 MAG: hypothetical protein A3D17_03905 [Bdellovibrionales bacterium RIFCSPHIGHO2_02_FULL_40_15]
MNRKTSSIIALAMTLSTTTFALTLDEYMLVVKTKNKVFRAYEASLEASHSKFVAGDLTLSPVFTAGYSLATDMSQPSTLGTKREIQEYSLGIAKKFSTGTAVSLSAQTDQFKNETAAPSDQFSTGGLGISLTQSLWKDFFGHGTRLRQQRESLVNQFESLGIDLKLRATAFDAESAYWDYAFAQEDLKLKKENLDRAKKMEKWTSNRVSNGISDRADLMNVRALAALREVQFATAEDDLKTQEIRIREYLVLDETEKTPDVTADLVMARLDVAQLAKSNKDIVKIDLYLSSLEAQSKQMIASEIKDSLRPDLSLVGSYGTTAYNREYSEVTANIADTDKPKTFIGLNFSWMFDTDAKTSQLSAASKDALASQYIAERNLVLGRIAWKELLRKYELTKKNIVTLEKVAQFQRERAKAEQDKFNKGRTVTANVVTAETDAAEAEVSLLRAKSGLRKLEASSLLFIAL